jgi:hypothetical protein
MSPTRRMFAGMGARGRIVAAVVLVAGAVGVAVAYAGTGSPVHLATGFRPIANETVWKTVGGVEIRANAGSIVKRGGVFYWFGMQYDGTITSHVFHGQIRLNEYSSNDLSHWSRVQTIIAYDTESPPPNDPDVQWYGRPDLLFNASTQTYVLSIERNVGNRNELAFYTATSPSGTFVWHPEKEIVLPDGLHTMGDKGVFQDTDGRAYLLFVSDDDAPAAFNTHTKIAPFTDDYLGLRPVISDCGGGGHEAMSVVKRAGTYYLFSSRTRGWRPSATTYKKAATLSQLPCQGGSDGNGWNVVGTTLASNNSFNTQHDFVLPVRGSKDIAYVYAGDRWSQFDPRVQGIGRYGWYPLTFDSAGAPLVHGLQSWSINATTGQWQP